MTLILAVSHFRVVAVEMSNESRKVETAIESSYYDRAFYVFCLYPLRLTVKPSESESV